jgi:lipopolysaccharide/colanic/teichoic acid biosynthesis glycosyltransferase
MGLHVHDGSVGGDSDATFLHDVAPTFRLRERAKRLLDIVVATMGLIIFVPILLIISVAIKLDSRGPIFIRETLYGDKNRTIQVLKFRLRTACAEGDRSNRRLTRVGRILWQTGVDELPQFIDVLRVKISFMEALHRAGV